MLRRATETLLHALGWLAAAYLAYWLVIFVEQVLSASLMASWAGLAPTWRLDAFGLRSFPVGRGPGADFEVIRRAQWLASSAVSLLFLPCALLFAQRLKSSVFPATQAARRIALLGAFWMAAHRLPDLFRMAQRGGGQMRLLWSFLPGEPRQLLASHISLFLLGILFFWFGVRAARELLPLIAHGHSELLARVLGSAALVIVACLLTLSSLMASVRFRAFEFGGGAAFLAAPVVAALGFLLLANLKSIPPGRSSPPGVFFSAGLLCFALVLAAGLAGADRFRLWRSEAAFERVITEHYEVLFPADRWPRAQAEQFAVEREARFAQFAQRLPADSGLGSMRIVVYADGQSQSRLAAGRGFNAIQFDSGAVRISAEETASVFPAVVDARLYLSQRWGAARSLVVADWAARWLIGEWAGQSLTRWAARLAHDSPEAAGLGSLAEFFAGAANRTLPPSEGEALGAAWLELVAANYGRGVVEKIYKAAPETFSAEDLAALAGTTLARLEQSWSAWKNSLPVDPQEKPVLSLSRAAVAGFFRGVSLKATELPAAIVDRELRRLRQLGADAVALTTHEHYRGGNKIQYHPNSGETDERLLRAIHSAQALGLRVLLKPHIYDGTEGFAGNICMDDAAARATFMRSYAQLILHYARIAQDERVALFSIGNELGCLTKHESDWRQLVRSVRRVYGGPLTYAANWGEEFESLRFGDALDFLGVNHYYPLTESSGDGLPEMLAHAKSVAHSLEKVQARWKKPLLFTEVGYPSVRGGSAKPWDPPSRMQDVQEQASAYEAVFRSFAGKPWMQGYFWWAWLDGDFSPADKPAEGVLRAWYAKQAQ